MAEEIEDAAPVFGLGDGVYIEGGRLDGTRGRIYYMDDERIRILPTGVSDRLVEIALIEGDLDPALKITGFLQTSPRANPAFVAQIDAQVEQIAETFGINGEPGIQYTIKEVNEAEDTIVLVDETGGEKRIEFNFVGIPIDEGFAVLRPRQKPSEDDFVNDAPEEVVEEDTFGDIEEAAVEEEKEVFAGLVERPAIQRIYPDVVQRNEMFQNLLEMLEPSAQKNLKRQREIRQLVEQFLLLRNEVVKYTPTGEPTGVPTPTSVQTIAELMEKIDIPLARPVLDAKRSVYLQRIEDAENPEELPEVDIDVNYLIDVLNASNEFLDTQLGGTTAQLVTDKTLPQWYSSWESFFKRFMRSWTSEGGTGTSVTFRGDKEFLRAPVPSGETNAKAQFTLSNTADGLTKLGENVYSTTSSVGKVRLSLLKGLGPRYLRVKDKEPTQRIEWGDEGTIMTQLLFPLNAERTMGSARSGRLAKDIANSHTHPSSIQEILEQLKGIPEQAAAGGIISIGDGGNTTGNIAIDEWLKSQPLQIRGLGDALVDTKNLGLTQMELTADQQETLIEKINQMRALLIQHITAERELSGKALTELRLENLTFLQGEALEDIMATLQSEPLLADRIEEIRTRIPAYKDNDLAHIAGIATQMSDLLLTVLAGVPGPLARERNRRVRNQFLEALRHALLKAEKNSNVGEIPQPIQCPHVDSINEIRKVKDDNDRMQLMSRLLARFRGPIVNNWVQCSVAAKGKPHNLMCYHEFLQLQEYLHPREKETLHKELLLKFSGGVFQGKFVCKNCGQAISELEFDANMEFDDNGRPLAGRAVMVDKAAAEQEEINLLLGAPADDGEDMKFASETQASIYTAARQVFDRLGIYADETSYKNITERVEADVQKQPSREEYAKMLKARKGEGKPLDYDILINRILVSSVGAHTLIEVQTHVPDYVIRSKIPGCVAGFSGFPVGKAEDKTGLNYISCAIAGITANKPPWNLTGFFTVTPEKKRQEMLAAGISKIATDALQTAAVQHAMSLKRAHYEKLYGTAIVGRQISEIVPPGFRPVPYYISPKEATEAIVVPEAAGPQELVRAWIQMAHRVARENGDYIRGSPFSDTTCCYTPISNPQGFWSTKGSSMPKLLLKSPPRGQACSQTMLQFTPRKAPQIATEAPEDLFYRVFLRVCYDGPRKGLPHEPGYTNKCLHCGFVFPDDPYGITPAPPFSKDLYKEWQAEVDGIITKGKSALESQRVVVDRSTFENVLDAAHNKFHVDLPEIRQPLTGIALLTRLLRIEPEPFDGCRRLLTETIARVNGLAPGRADDIAIAEAYSPISEYMVEMLGTIGMRIGAPAAETLRALLKQSPAQIVESVRTYFLVPFQRLSIKFKPESLKVQKSYLLPREIEENINDTIAAHLEYLQKLARVVGGYTAVKLEQARRQLAALLPVIQNEIRAYLVPGAAAGATYLVGGLITGVLGEFINPNVVPDGVSGTGGRVETTARVPINILEVCLSRLQLEGLNFTEDEIRDLIALRTNAEKDLFVKSQNGMTPVEKKADLMMKRLGIGKWAIGGTKAVSTLNPEMLELEREQRIQMGLGDFVTNQDDAARATALINDEMYGGGGDGAEGGYENAQEAVDDF